MNNDVFNPPRGGNIYNMRCTLRHEARQVINYNPCDGPSESASEEDMNDDNEQGDNRERNTRNQGSQGEQSSTMEEGV